MSEPSPKRVKEEDDDDDEVEEDLSSSQSWSPSLAEAYARRENFNDAADAALGLKVVRDMLLASRPEEILGDSDPNDVILEARLWAQSYVDHCDMLICTRLHQQIIADAMKELVYAIQEDHDDADALPQGFQFLEEHWAKRPTHFIRITVKTDDLRTQGPQHGKLRTYIEDKVIDVTGPTGTITMRHNSTWENEDDFITTQDFLCSESDGEGPQREWHIRNRCEEILLRVVLISVANKEDMLYDVPDDDQDDIVRKLHAKRDKLVPSEFVPDWERLLESVRPFYAERDV